jgi:hypothetical protein
VAEVPGRSLPGLAAIDKVKNLGDQFRGNTTDRRQNAAMLESVQLSVVAFLERFTEG